MLVEFQFRAHRFCQVLRRRVARELPCLPVIPVPGKGGLVVDRIELVADPHLERRPWLTSPIPGGATIIQLVQPIRILAATVDQLAAAGPDPLAHSAYEEVVADILFVMRIDDEGALTVNYDNFRTSSPLPPGMQPIIDAALDGINVTVPLDLAPMAPLIGQNPFDFGAVAADDSFERLAILLDFGQGGVLLDDATWLAYLTGSIANNLDMTWSWLVETKFHGKTHKVLKETKSRQVHLDWSVRVDRRFLTRRIRAQIEDAVAGTELVLDQPPQVTWVEEYSGQPRLTVMVKGQVHDVGVFSQDVTVILNATSLMQLVPGPQLQTYTYTSIKVKEDVSLASLLLGMFVGMFVGFLPGGVAASGPAMAIGGLLGALSAGAIVTMQTVVQTAAGMANVDSASPGPEWTCEDVESGASQCTLPIDALTNDVLGQLTVMELLGHGGLVMGGQWTGAIGQPSMSISKVTVEPFGWGFLDPCESDAIVASGGVTIEAVGDIPLDHCGSEIVDGTDPVDQFQDGDLQATEDAWVGSSRVSVMAEFGRDDVSRSYLRDPYPMVILVRTNAGARVVSVPGIPLLTDAVADQMLMKHLADKVINCHDYVAVDAWWGATHKFNPKWHIDPPPDRELLDVMHLWEVHVVGLVPGGRFMVETIDGRPVASVAAALDGSTHVSLAAEPGGDQWVFVRDGTRAPLGSAGMRVRQSLITRTARLAHGSPITFLALREVDGLVEATCRTESGVTSVYRIDRAGTAVKIGITRLADAGDLRPVAMPTAAFRRVERMRHPWFDGVVRAGWILARPVGEAAEIWAVVDEVSASHIAGQS